MTRRCSADHQATSPGFAIRSRPEMKAEVVSTRCIGSYVCSGRGEFFVRIEFPGGGEC